MKGQTQSFCSISPNLRHDPSAIWAHMKPVLEEAKTENPTLDVIHFISDSLCTQYRSSKNFFLMKTLIHSRYGFKYASWNFTEAGHGKGAADGVGGLIKRTADKLVTHGLDIRDASALFSALKEKTAVKLYYVTDTMIDEVDKILPRREVKVAGVMKVHQVRSHQQQSFIDHRILSCFCSFSCQCFEPKTVDLNVSSLQPG